ncbi:hypothetical protein HKX48_001264, partial [Thoreauomyces humboldtii]
SRIHHQPIDARPTTASLHPRETQPTVHHPQPDPTRRRSSLGKGRVRILSLLHVRRRRGAWQTARPDAKHTRHQEDAQAPRHRVRPGGKHGPTHRGRVLKGRDMQPAFPATPRPSQDRQLGPHLNNTRPRHSHPDQPPQPQGADQGRHGDPGIQDRRQSLLGRLPEGARTEAEDGARGRSIRVPSPRDRLPERHRLPPRRTDRHLLPGERHPPEAGPTDRRGRTQGPPHLAEEAGRVRPQGQHDKGELQRHPQRGRRPGRPLPVRQGQRKAPRDGRPHGGGTFVRTLPQPGGRDRQRHHPAVVQHRGDPGHHQHRAGVKEEPPHTVRARGQPLHGRPRPVRPGGRTLRHEPGVRVGEQRVRLLVRVRGHVRRQRRLLVRQRQEDAQDGPRRWVQAEKARRWRRQCFFFELLLCGGQGGRQEGSGGREV